jgi:hypothetical protein
MYKENWKDMCGGNQELINFVYATVVKDEFYPRIPDHDDIKSAQQRLVLSKKNAPSLPGSERILISAPDKLVL